MKESDVQCSFRSTNAASSPPRACIAIIRDLFLRVCSPCKNEWAAKDFRVTAGKEALPGQLVTIPLTSLLNQQTVAICRSEEHTVYCFIEAALTLAAFGAVLAVRLQYCWH